MGDTNDPTAHRFIAPDLAAAWQKNCALQQSVLSILNPNAPPLQCAVEPPAGATVRGLENQNRQIEKTMMEYNRALTVSRA